MKILYPLSAQADMWGAFATTVESPDPLQVRYEAARTDLALYGQLVHGWEAQPHHKIWIDALTESDEDLLLLAPPGSAKTNWVMAFIGWWLGNHPDQHIIYCGNTYNQAAKPSRAIRDTIAGNPAYKAIFPDAKPDPRKGWGEAAWYLARPDLGDKDPTLCSTGIGGSILGARANLIVMDDVNDEENTTTAYLREKTWNWINSTLFSRRSPGSHCRRVGIMTPWTGDDVSAQLTELGFRVISMPVIGYWTDDPEAVLWPMAYPANVLEEAKLANPRRYNAMYLMRPTPPGGTIWKSEYWRHYAEAPQVTFILQSLDTAFKDAEGNDYTVATTWGVSSDGFVLLDVVRRKMEFPELVATTKALYSRYRPNIVLVEDHASGQSLIQVLQKETRIPIIAVKADKSKENRAWAVVGMAQGGRVLLPERASWLAEYVAEMEEFPNGKHDDQADSSSQALAYLQRFGGANIGPVSDVPTDKPGLEQEALGPEVMGSTLAGYKESRWKPIRRERR